MHEVSSGITVGEALARVRGEGRPPRPDRATSPGTPTRFRRRAGSGARREWSARELAAASLGVMALGAVVLGAQGPGAHSARPAVHRAPAAPVTAARSGTDRRPGSHDPSPTPFAAAVAVGAPASSAPAVSSTTGANLAAGGSETHAPRPSRGAAAGGTSPTATAPGSTAAPTTTSTSTSTSSPPTTPAPGGPGAPSGSSVSDVVAWDIQYGSNLVSLGDDISAVDAAQPSASGDYSAVVTSWQQLASDVGAAQAAAPVPDAGVQATWSSALEQLSTACADWLASLTSTSPPSGAIADQSLFDAGTAAFTQGASDFASAQSAITGN